MSLRDERIVMGEIDGELPAGRRAELERSNAEILADLPPAMVAAEIERRLARAQQVVRRRRAAWMSGAVSCAAAVAILLVVWPRGDGAVELAPEIVRIKGSPQLAVFRKELVGASRLASDSPVRAGDVLQLSYNAAGARHGIILSVDGRGLVTLHHPETPDAPTALEPGGLIPLDFAYRLDDAPSFERFFLITASTPLDVADTVAAFERWAGRDGARPATDKPPVDGARVRSIRLRKVSP